MLVLKLLIISLTQYNILEILIKRALNNILDARENLEGLDKIVRFLLEKSYFQFNSDVNKKISETTIGTKFAPLYACIFMDELENHFFTMPITATFSRI